MAKKMIEDRVLANAQDMISLDADRDYMLDGLRDMFLCDWELPDGVPDDTYKAISSDPRDSVISIIRARVGDAP